MSSQKVLVTGPLPSSPTSSSLKPFFLKLAKLHLKHTFSLVLSLTLFDDIPNDSIELNELLAGKIQVPVQVYVGVGNGVIPDKVREKFERGEEIAENVTLLGKSGLLTLASGLKLATFGGSYDPDSYDSPEGLGGPLSSPHFTSTSLQSFISSLSPPPSKPHLPPPPKTQPDILLTNSLPSSLHLLSTKSPFPTQNLSEPMNEVAKECRAKYHFSGGQGIFWEREPFKWGNGAGEGSCRVITLGEALGKERWFYAFSITPSTPGNTTIIPLPVNSTPSPFSSSSSLSAATSTSRGIKRPAGSLDSSSNSNSDVNEYGIPNYIFGGQGGGGGNQKKGRREGGGSGGPPPDHYTCNICEKKGHWIQECPEKSERDAQRGPRNPPARPIQPEECWFCLSNPKVTKHLIASIGTEVYVTLPKGQLIPTNSDGAMGEKNPVPGGGHVLIIPIAHYSTIQSIPKEVAEPIVEEIEKYKKGLSDFYKKHGAEMISFEVGRTTGKGGHAHVQICPIPSNLASTAEEIFRSEGSKHGIEFTEDPSILEQGGPAENYFRAELPGEKTLVHIIKQGVPFGLQFGRETVATLLGTPERVDWKVCTKSNDEEKKDCQAFKVGFKEFDPSE